MNRSILFVIGDDPRVSGRPAEAIRIAAGINQWDKVGVSVYLRDAAVLILGENRDDLVDADNYERYLPLLAKPDRPIYAQSGSPSLRDMEKSPLAFREISDTELARFGSKPLTGNPFLMARILHILTCPDDSPAREIITRQKESGADEVAIVDLTKPNSDYESLLEMIFASDSVESW